jgi:hypothetical protein
MFQGQSLQAVHEMSSVRFLTTTKVRFLTKIIKDLKYVIFC